MQDNLEAFVEGTFRASERIILITKWVGQVWQQECLKTQGNAICGFKKYAMSVAALTDPKTSYEHRKTVNITFSYGVEDPFVDISVYR